MLSLNSEKSMRLREKSKSTRFMPTISMIKSEQQLMILIVSSSSMKVTSVSEDSKVTLPLFAYLSGASAKRPLLNLSMSNS
jgi:hypothetical protein